MKMTWGECIESLVKIEGCAAERMVPCDVLPGAAGIAETAHEFDALQLMRDQTPEQQAAMVALLKCYLLGDCFQLGQVDPRDDTGFCWAAETVDYLVFGATPGDAALALAEKLEKGAQRGTE